MELPKLAGDSSIDVIIDQCWHNKYPTIASLAADTEAFLLGCKSKAIMQEMLNGQQEVGPSRDMTWGDPTKEFLVNKALCESLEKQGLLDLLSTNDPEQLGFACAWYRHSS
jgi:hypothetical protein